MQYCSLQHLTLLSPLDTSTTECHFCFGPTASFFLEPVVIAFYSSPVAYLTPYDLGDSSCGVIYFCLFTLFVVFSREEFWSRLSFPFLVDHVWVQKWQVFHKHWISFLAVLWKYRVIIFFFLLAHLLCDIYSWVIFTQVYGFSFW